MKSALIIMLLLLFIPILFISTSRGYIIDVEPKPNNCGSEFKSYCNDFIIPKEVETMATKEIYELTVIISMITVNLLKVYGTYLIVKTPDTKFNSAYIVSGVLGVFIGYSIFIPAVDYSGTLIDIFMEAGKASLLGTFAFDFYAKVKEKSENK